MAPIIILTKVVAVVEVQQQQAQVRNLLLPFFTKSRDITRLIRHDFNGNPDELQNFLDDCNLAYLYCPRAFKNINYPFY